MNRQEREKRKRGGGTNYRHDLEPAVERAEAAILAVARQSIPACSLRRIGPLDFGQGASWSCWLVTPTDEDRNALKRNATLLVQMQTAAQAAGFAPDGIVVESQETVERDYEGSWFYAMR